MIDDKSEDLFKEMNSSSEPLGKKKSIQDNKQPSSIVNVANSNAKWVEDIDIEIK